MTTREESIAALLRSLDDAREHGRSLPGVVDLWLGHLDRTDNAKPYAMDVFAKGGNGKWSGEDEWDRIEPRLRATVAELDRVRDETQVVRRLALTDNARLRALIKAALEDVDWCPWCKADQGVDATLHADDCPAFTPEGEVK